jgi:hypothetical protein
VKLNNKDPKKSFTEYCEWEDELNYIYNKYSDISFFGFDWDNDPPPLEILDERMCISDVRNEPLHLGRIPAEFRTAKVCYEAVYLDDDALQFVPENLREEIKARKDAITEKQWLTELGWYDCQYSSIKLTKKLLTLGFCHAMVEANGCTYCLLPEELKTPELLELAKKNVPNYCHYDNPPPVN